MGGIFNFRNSPGLIGILLVAYIAWLIHPALIGNIPGILQPRPVPHSTQMLNGFLGQEDLFYRVLWTPEKIPFAINTINHPSLSSKDFDVFKEILNLQTEKEKVYLHNRLIDSSIRYIVVPNNYKDRKKYILYLDKIGWLVKKSEIGENTIYEVPEYRKHISIINNSDANVLINSQTPTKYTVHLNSVRIGDELYFSESYDPYWNLFVGNQIIKPIESDNHFNLFKLTKDGNYSVVIEYSPQRIINKLLVVSIISLVVSIGFVVWYKITRL